VDTTESANGFLGRLRAACIRAASLLRRIACGQRQPPTPETELGQKGERTAARFLKREGYRVLERNFRCTGGEIDLVVFRDGVIAFVEVRSRVAPAQVDPMSTVTRPKQQRLIRAAHRYAALHNLHREDVVLRFDVVAVLFDGRGRPDDVRHVENAFQL